MTGITNGKTGITELCNYNIYDSPKINGEVKIHSDWGDRNRCIRGQYSVPNVSNMVLVDLAGEMTDSF